VSSQLRHRRSTHYFQLLAAGVGVAVGIAVSLVALASSGPGGPPYSATSVAVPTDANATHPYAVSFRGATFTMWWPYTPPGSASTGSPGVRVQIIEATGVIGQTTTGCDECFAGLQNWYSSDGSVGISYHDGSGRVTLLVEV
jgi:hypothetical protein